MENEVSALMDGELESENISRVVEMLNRNSELKQHWETYHLISDAHHILEGRIPGRRSHDFCTIPLCKDCHQNERNGIHGQQFMLKIMKENELNLLGETIKKLYGK